MEEVSAGPVGPFADLEVIRVQAGMSTTRFCTMIDMPERTWRRWQAKARAGQQSKGPWPQPARQAARGLATTHALAHPAWGHRKVWAMVRHDRHVVSQATVLRLLRDEGLILPASYQRERRQLAQRRKAAFAKDPTGANQVWQLDFSEFETTAGGTWWLAGCRDSGRSTSIRSTSRPRRTSMTPSTPSSWPWPTPRPCSATATRTMPGRPPTGELLPVVMIVTDNGGRSGCSASRRSSSWTPESPMSGPASRRLGRTAHANVASAPEYERLYIDEIDDAVDLAERAEDYRVEYNETRPQKPSRGTGPRRCTWASPILDPDLSNQRNPASYLTRDRRARGRVGEVWLRLLRRRCWLSPPLARPARARPWTKGCRRSARRKRSPPVLSVCRR